MKNRVCCERGKCRICPAGGIGVAMNERLYGLGYLSAVAPIDPDREAIVSKLKIVMGESDARAAVLSLERLIERRASSGASAVVIKGLWGVVAVNVVFMMLRR